MKKRYLSTLIASTFIISSYTYADSELEAAAKKANNPVSDVWMLVTQYDMTTRGGDAIGSDKEYSNRLSFQPVMPVPIFDGEWNMVNRLVFQTYSNSYGDEDNFRSSESGLGDTVYMSLFAPNRDDGFIWGFGPSLILPTATEDSLGQKKWQAGPAALAVRLGNSYGGAGIENWNIGVLGQHWWDVGGSDSITESTNQSDIQYFINWKLNATQMIGMTPNIQIDWDKDGSDRFSIPIGLGTIGMFKWGETPMRWGVEMQYYVNQPDEFGPEYNLKFFIAPIKANPFK